MPVSELDLQFIARERRRHAREAAGDDYTRIPFDLPVRQTALTAPIGARRLSPTREKKREKRCDEVFAIQAHG